MGRLASRHPLTSGSAPQAGGLRPAAQGRSRGGSTRHGATEDVFLQRRQLEAGNPSHHTCVAEEAAPRWPGRALGEGPHGQPGPAGALGATGWAVSATRVSSGLVAHSANHQPPALEQALLAPSGPSPAAAARLVPPQSTLPMERGGAEAGGSAELTRHWGCGASGRKPEPSTAVSGAQCRADQVPERHSAPREGPAGPYPLLGVPGPAGGDGDGKAEAASVGQPSPSPPTGNGKPVSAWQRGGSPGESAHPASDAMGSPQQPGAALAEATEAGGRPVVETTGHGMRQSALAGVAGRPEASHITPQALSKDPMFSGASVAGPEQRERGPYAQVCVSAGDKTQGGQGSRFRPQAHVPVPAQAGQAHWTAGQQERVWDVRAAHPWAGHAVPGAVAFPASTGMTHQQHLQSIGWHHPSVLAAPEAGGIPGMFMEMGSRWPQDAAMYGTAAPWPVVPRAWDFADHATHGYARGCAPQQPSSAPPSSVAATAGLHQPTVSSMYPHGGQTALASDGIFGSDGSASQQSQGHRFAIGPGGYLPQQTYGGQQASWGPLAAFVGMDGRHKVLTAHLSEPSGGYAGFVDYAPGQCDLSASHAMRAMPVAAPHTHPGGGWQQVPGPSMHAGLPAGRGTAGQWGASHGPVTVTTAVASSRDAWNGGMPALALGREEAARRAGRGPSVDAAPGCDDASTAGEQRWECPECERTFASEAYLRRHFRFAHQGIRDFQCPQCPAAFTTPSNLYRHVRKQHGVAALRKLKQSRGRSRTHQPEFRRQVGQNSEEPGSPSADAPDAFAQLSPKAADHVGGTALPSRRCHGAASEAEAPAAKPTRIPGTVLDDSTPPTCESRGNSTYGRSRATAAGVPSICVPVLPSRS